MRTRAVIKTKAWSLKAYLQKGTFFFLFVLSVFLMTYHKSESEKMAVYKAYLDDALVNVMDVMSSPGKFIINLYQSVENYFFVIDENQRLRLENEQLRLWQQTAIRLDVENQSYRRSLALNDKQSEAFLSAHIIGDLRHSHGQTYLLKIGSQDGVRIGQPVVVGKSLVGRITQTGENSSRVMLLNDLDSHIPVKMSSTGDRAMLSGNGQNGLILEYLSDDVQLSEDDYVITSGSEGLLPEGLLVGRIKGFEKNVVPIMSPDKLDIVQILIDKRSLYEDLEQIRFVE